jgi:hypothetical protein
MLAQLAEKRMFTAADVDAQTAVFLPERETPATVIIGCLALCVGQIRINVTDVNVAAQVCAAVDVLRISLLSLTGTSVSCTIRQH